MLLSSKLVSCSSDKYASLELFFSTFELEATGPILSSKKSSALTLDVDVSLIIYIRISYLSQICL